MKYRRLGKTGLEVSEVGFGCWAIGGTSYGTVRDEDSLEALETAFGHGVNFFDTADIYGQGHSEEILARFLKGKKRDQLIIATKAGFDFYHGPVKKNFDPDYLRFACEESLKRLGVEAVDLFQLHNPPPEMITREEIFQVLARLKAEGKIRFIGVSVFSEEEGLTAVRDRRIDSLQIVLNLIDQRMTHRVLPEAQERNMGIIAREPLACGFLTGKYAGDHRFPKNDHRNGWSKEKIRLALEKVEIIKTILVTDRLSLTRAALEYVLDFEAVSTVIPGAKTKPQVLENILASESPCLRSQESYHLRDIYHREPIFSEGLDAS